MAGSEFAKRVAVGTILVGMVIPATFIHPLALLLLTLGWMGVATREFLSILRFKGVILDPYLFIPLNLLFPISCYLKIPEFYPALGSLFLVSTYLLFKNPSSRLVAVSAGMFTIFYLGWLPAHLIALRRLNLLPWHTLFPFIATWINDTVGYVIGSAVGAHKLAPRVSPKKSWEGVGGGVVASVAVCLGYKYWLFPDSPLPPFVVMGLLWSWIALLGDLLESSFKREAGLKDSSHLLPGHGGFLDRIDSLLFTIPFFYYYLRHILLA